MHQSSYDKMKTFKEKYLDVSKELKILDIGSLDVNGSYKEIFLEKNWFYQGTDMEPGKNVDILLDTPYFWKNIPSDSYDVVISGQAFEHIEFFWITILEINRILKKNGIVCIIAPAGGFEHKYPLDCWRYYPDGLRALAKWGKFEVLEATTQWEKQNYKIDDSDLWMDSMLVGKKLSTEENLQQITTFLNNWINKNKNKSDHWVEGNYENNHETTNYNYLNSLPYEERARLTLLSIYRQRKDLQVHYPEANNGINLSNLICWAKNYGIKEVPQLTLYSDFYEKNCK